MLAAIILASHFAEFPTFDGTRQFGQSRNRSAGDRASPRLKRLHIDLVVALDTTALP
jgi:hypothetical protein